VFAAALLNSQPMGFYQPAQLVDDAKQHGVDVRPVDINYSCWDNTLEEQSGKYRALRLGFRQIKSLREEDIKKLIEARGSGYTTINELRDAGISNAVLERLSDADAFRSLNLDRRQALWEVSTKDQSEALFKGQQTPDAKNENISLPEMLLSEHVVHDYAATALSLKAHPVSFLRLKLNQLNIIPTKGLKEAVNGQFVKVAGLVLVRQRPGTAGGVCFMTIADETGVANLVIFQSLFETYRKEILQARLIMVEGTLQIEGEVIHVIVKRCHDFSKLLRQLTPSKTEIPNVQTLAFPDETSIPAGLNKSSQVREDAQEKIFPDARNFK
jgi:error-prone DNA polymerase